MALENTAMIIITPSYAGYGNRGGDPTTITQGKISVTQTQDGVGNDTLTLQPPPHPPAGTTAGAAGHTVGATGGNGAGRGGGTGNPHLVDCLATFHMVHLPESTGTITTAIAKTNTPAEQRALATRIHQFLTYGNSNLWDLNGYYKHFNVLVAVPGTYMTKVPYSQGSGAVVIGKFYPAQNKLLSLFDKVGG